VKLTAPTGVYDQVSSGAISELVAVEEMVTYGDIGRENAQVKRYSTLINAVMVFGERETCPGKDLRGG
jgi:hypothetical protein